MQVAKIRIFHNKCKIWLNVRNKYKNMSFVFGNVEIFIIKKRQSEEIILSCSHVIVQVYRADIFRRFEFRSWS